MERMAKALLAGKPLNPEILGPSSPTNLKENQK
jgi:hypothetical protein